MDSMRLGRTGLEISRIGFGGIPIQRLDETRAVAVVRRCVELGVTFLDTANAYTTSEARIGKAIVGRRDGLVIATKTGARDREMALSHLETSLSALQTPTIDLWQFHNVSTFEAYEQILGRGGAMEAAREAVEEGKVRHIGISSHLMDVALEAVRSGHFETVQFPFNFVTNEPADELVPLARERDVGFIAMKPLAGGLLDDANLAIKYLLQFDGVVPDPGIERVQEIEEIVDIVSGSLQLTAQEQAEIARIRGELGTTFCRRCGYCQPCPQGINLPFVLNVDSFWRRFPAEHLISGPLAEDMARARDCAACGECEEKCPYGLPIREMLQQKIKVYDRLVAAR
jgi:predicted aldo/keto reductase-like oxidoreductase